MITTKDFNKKQLKLLRGWLNHPRFLNKNVDPHDIQLIKNVIQSGTYTNEDKTSLMIIRQRWINFLFQEQKLIYLTRNQKNTMTNGMLNSKESFRMNLPEGDVNFLIQSLKDGYYQKKYEDQFIAIFQKWKLYDDLPF